MSSSQYSSPLKIDLTNNEVEVLKPIPITAKDGSFNEAFIQDLVFRFPNSLPVEQIDRTFSPLIPVCCELRTPAGPLDVLYVTPEGRLVILEAKLWRNPEARRKVVAQILDYAKEFRKWDYEDLQREVSRATGDKGNVLYNLAKKHNSELSESEFVDGVSRSLSSGRFLLLIVGDGIREGAAGIADFLSDVGNLEFTFGLVELAIYQAENKQIIVQPRVLVKTAIIQRTVVSVKNGKIDLEDSDSGFNEELEEKGEQILKDHEIYYTQFWPEFIDQLQLDDKSQPMPSVLGKVTKFSSTFFHMPPNGHVSWLTVYFDKKASEVGVFLCFRRGNDIMENAYKQLKLDREEITQDLGLDVEWDSIDGKNTVTIKRNFDELFAESNREEIKRFFSDSVNRFVNTFRPRLQKILDDL